MLAGFKGRKHGELLSVLYKIACGIFVFLLLTVFLEFEVPAEEKEQEELIILHTNNEQGIIENMGRIAYKKRQLEKKYDNVFLVSAGGFFSGLSVVDK